MTPYELAAFYGLEPAADLLRESQPATSHPTGMTDLWLTAASGLSEPAIVGAVRELVDRHDVNAIWQQATPLLMAVGYAAHFQVADLLLKAGASLNVGTSLLHVHFHFEHLVGGLRYLSGVGWNVNSCDSEGQTALHKAALAGYAGAIRALIELKADAGAKDSSGLTTLDIAHRFNKRAAIKGLARGA